MLHLCYNFPIVWVDKKATWCYNKHTTHRLEVNNMNIGEIIKKRRIMLGMSQEELAVKTGYTTANNKSAISKIETGANDISRSKISVFARALKTSEAYLMGWTDNPELSTEDAIANEFSTVNDFTYAMLDETKDLSEEQQAAILAMVKTYKKQLGK